MLRIRSCIRVFPLKHTWSAGNWICVGAARDKAKNAGKSVALDGTVKGGRFGQPRHLSSVIGQRGPTWQHAVHFLFRPRAPQNNRGITFLDMVSGLHETRPK
jgi:hypothetical protein